jgi:ABC-2 type transport system ATP-binding protein
MRARSWDLVPSRATGCDGSVLTMAVDAAPATTHTAGSHRPEGEPVLRCRGLVRRFGEQVAVDGVSFEVMPGETYGLLGPNGAGKSTCIRMICGLLAADAGEVLVEGRPVDRAAVDAKASIGFVPQDVALYPDLSARENLRFFGRLYRLGRGALDERVEDVLGLVDLTDRADDRVDAFSGGMKRRLNIAAGLIHEPHLLVLDEPTVGVDPQSRHAILESVQRLSEGGMAVLYTTHYMEEAERLCDRIGIIDRGELVIEGTRAELVAQLAERDHIKLSADGDLSALAAACSRLDGIDTATVVRGGLDLVARDGRRLLRRIFELSEQHDVDVTSVQVIEPDLETVFLHLTGTELRE